MSKLAKGTQDYCDDIELRNTVIDKITFYFNRYNGKEIDTPILECLDGVKNLYKIETTKSDPEEIIL